MIDSINIHIYIYIYIYEHLYEHLFTNTQPYEHTFTPTKRCARDARRAALVSVKVYSQRCVRKVFVKKVFVKVFVKPNKSYIM